MRKYGRSALVAISLVSGLFAWAACGDDDGAAPPAVDQPDAGRDAKPAPLRDATVIIEDDASEPDAAKPPPNRDAGPEDFQTLDGGDIAVPCTQGGVLEAESNDTKETANPLTGPAFTRCGVARVKLADPLDAGPDADAGDADAEAGDADAGDAAVVAESDIMTYTLSPGAKDFYVQYHGEDIEVFVQPGDGGVLDITKPGVTLPFFRDRPYFIEVRSKSGKNELWRVTVFEDK